jgi:hypothetical protein
MAQRAQLATKQFLVSSRCSMTGHPEAESIIEPEACSPPATPNCLAGAIDDPLAVLQGLTDRRVRAIRGGGAS